MLQQVDNSLLIPVPNKSYHNLDSETITTTSFGKLTPIFCMETVPGGSYDISNETLCRFMPLSSPVMHKMTIKTHYFYVPYRLLWDNWENFIMGRKDPLTGLDPVHPFFRRDLLTKNATNGKTIPELGDYFGFRPGANITAEDTNLNPFAFSAYQMIYNWYYRHKSVKDEYPYKLEDGEIAPLDLQEIYSVLRQITFEDDYFTSCLPTPQEGAPVFVDSDSQLLTNVSGGRSVLVRDAANSGLAFATTPETQPNPNDGILDDSLFARTRILVEEIRRAAKLQQYVELQNHAKTYIDFLKAQYNVDLQDYRLGIPEYITGFSQPIMISDVTNQSDNFQGRITGQANSYATSKKETYYAREHGLIIGIAAVTYKSKYNDALPKIHTKTGRFDYFTPIFDNLGEQVVKNGEVIAEHLHPNEPFGYVPRHHEYRSSFDMITGEAKTSFAHWHLGRGYIATAGLTEDWYDVIDDRRIFAYQNTDFDPILLQVYNNIRAQLPLGQVSHPQL